MDPLKVFRSLYSGYKAIAEDLGRMQTAGIQHNTVNRRRNMVITGLFTQEENFYPRDSRKFEIYVRTNHFSRKDLEKIFAFIGEQGYGKDKSTGKGHFSSTVRDGNELVENGNPNGFMTLSSFIPTGGDPTDGFYSPLHKYGKLGGLFAKGILDGNPFKTPLIMFAAGSTFRDNGYYHGKTYGSILGGVHRNDRIRHYAHAYPLGIRLRDDL